MYIYTWHNCDIQNSWKHRSGLDLIGLSEIRRRVCSIFRCDRYTKEKEKIEFIYPYTDGTNDGDRMEWLGGTSHRMSRGRVVVAFIVVVVVVVTPPSPFKSALDNCALVSSVDRYDRYIIYRSNIRIYTYNIHTHAYTYTAYYVL